MTALGPAGDLFLFPTVFMLVSSLKTDENQLLQDLSSVNAFIPYGDISLQNYSDAFHRLPFGLYMFNTVLIVTCILALGLVVNSLIAYTLARIPFCQQAHKFADLDP